MDFRSSEAFDCYERWLSEDVGNGDYSSLSSIPEGALGESTLILKDDGVVAGLEMAIAFFEFLDPHVEFVAFYQDGDILKKGTILGTANGSLHSLLKGERLMLNLMQRLSGIATQTKSIVDLVKGTTVRILDTRKTSPGLRMFEKWAVTQGGGYNHRMGLYDMVMLKDNHLDSAGGITAAVERTKSYLKSHELNLKIEVETRNLDEVREALKAGVDRIMFDNFTPELTIQGVNLVNGQCETESSGGITLETIAEYARTGVDFISVGSITHSVKALDISFKTKIKSE
jgi:nicotinate-nucleotide pyrophosphorylase (carboxylating)